MVCAVVSVASHAQTIAKGADVNAQDQKGHTPLIFAATNGHTPVVKFLVGAGAVTVVPDLRLNALIIQANPTDVDLLMLEKVLGE